MPGRSNRLPARRRPGLVLHCGHPGGGSDGRMWQMPISENARSAAAIHRKLRGLAAVFLDPAATEHEKANAKILKGRLEKRLWKQHPRGNGLESCFGWARALRR